MNDLAFSPVGYGLAGKMEMRAVAQGKLYSYIFAGNGVFCYARRPGLEALAPVARGGMVVRGLAEVQPFVVLERTVPLLILQKILMEAGAAFPLEMLFTLHLEENGWRLVIPQQVQTPGSCVPVVRSGEEVTGALIELHSHGAHAPYFSPMDDRDEQGFRVFSVIGALGKKPAIRTRVGVFGSFWEFPSHWIYELPEGLADAVEFLDEGDLP